MDTTELSNHELWTLFRMKEQISKEAYTAVCMALWLRDLPEDVEDEPIPGEDRRIQ